MARWRPRWTHSSGGNPKTDGDSDRHTTRTQKYQHTLEQQPFVSCLVTAKMIHSVFSSSCPSPPVVLGSHTCHKHSSQLRNGSLSYLVASVRTLLAARVVAVGGFQLCHSNLWSKT